MLDGTAGLGGNTISFCKYFKYLLAIEYNTNRFTLLKNNIELFHILNIKLLNEDSINLIIENNLIKNINCYFFDPPWGGIYYKKKKNIEFKLGNYNLNNIIELIKNINEKKIIIFKLPKNYNLAEFSNFNYKIYKIKNYLLLFFF